MATKPKLAGDNGAALTFGMWRFLHSECKDQELQAWSEEADEGLPVTRPPAEESKDGSPDPFRLQAKQEQSRSSDAQDG